MTLNRNPSLPAPAAVAPGSIVPGAMKWEGFIQAYERAIGHAFDVEQSKAVKHGAGPLFIMAGPGSGKSEVIVARTLKLVLVDGADPRSLFVTTFTDKAARNLQDRVSDRLLRMGFKTTLDDLNVGTLHSLCDGIMRDFRYELYHDTRLLDDVEQSFFIHRELHDWLQESPREFWDEFHYLHRTASREFGPNLWQRADTFQVLVNRVTEEEVAVEALVKSGSEHLQHLAEGIQTYRDRLAARSRSDFAHVQQQFGVFLASNVGRTFLNGDPARGIPPLTHLLVDEYQDTNPIQESIYFALARACGGNITVVGDDDQALYRFRGGTVECLVRFQEKCERDLQLRVGTRQLLTNYRSVKEITDWCERVITAQPAMASKGARAAGKKPMVSDRGPAENYSPVRRVGADKYDAVGGEMAAIIRALIQDHFVHDPSDIAILLRSAKESPRNAGPIVSALRRAGIPVYNPRSKAFLEAEEVVTMLGGIIRLVDEDLIIGSTLRGSQVDSIEGWCRTWDRVTRGYADIREYVKLFHERLAEKALGQYLKIGLLDVFYRLLSFKPFSDWQEGPERTSRLGQLSSILEAYVSVEHGNAFKMSSHREGHLSEGWLRGSFYPRLVGYLHRAELDDPEDVDYEIVPGRVQVMTVHQSKGLEFPFVFAGSIAMPPKDDDSAYLLEDLLVPLSSNPRTLAPRSDRAIQDLVRFHYVQASRAQDVLTLFGTESHFGKARVSVGLPEGGG